MTFEDGTVYSDLANGVNSQWVSVADLLAFESSESSAITVTDSGVVELVSNAADVVTITLSSQCTPEVFLDFDLYANLKPVSYDIDVGDALRTPVPALDVGQEVDINIRIQTGSFDITSFQLVVSFDPTILIVESDSKCFQGGNWKTGAWECTTNDPIGRSHVDVICSRAV